MNASFRDRRHSAFTLAIFAGLATLECVPRPDLVPAPLLNPDGSPVSGPAGFCRSDNQLLLVHVANVGGGDAAPSRAQVAFQTTSGQTVSMKNVSEVPAGATVPVSFEIPDGCFSHDCNFTIRLDLQNAVQESNESNNTADGTCIG